MSAEAYAAVSCDDRIGFRLMSDSDPRLQVERLCLQGSKAVHWAYAKRALMKIPSLEDYEERQRQHEI